jgi:hypothetical protein
VALIRTYVSEELSVSIIRVTRIGEQGTTLAVTSNRCEEIQSESGMLHRVALVRTDWDVTPCGSCKSHFVFLHIVRRLLVTANVVPSLPILIV